MPNIPLKVRSDNIPSEKGPITRNASRQIVKKALNVTENGPILKSTSRQIVLTAPKETQKGPITKKISRQKVKKVPKVTKKVTNPEVEDPKVTKKIEEPEVEDPKVTQKVEHKDKDPKVTQKTEHKVEDPKVTRKVEEPEVEDLKVTPKVEEPEVEDPKESEILFGQRKRKQLKFDFLHSGTEFEIYPNKPPSKTQLEIYQEKTSPKFELKIYQDKSSLKVNPRSNLLPCLKRDDIIRRLFNAGCHKILDKIFINLTRSDIESYRRVCPDWNSIVMFYLGHRVNRIEKVLMRKVTSADKIENVSLDFPKFQDSVKFSKFLAYVDMQQLQKRESYA